MNARLLPPPWAAWFQLPVIALLVLFAGFWSINPTREQEFRVILTAQEMADGGNWLIPEYQGETRLQKPPLMYWMAAAAYKLAGTTASPLPPRAVNLLLSAGLALLVWRMGTSIAGHRAGLISAVVCVTTTLFARHGFIAETDLPLSLFTAMAVYAAWRALQSGGRMGWWWTAGLAMGLGFMTKGPASVAVPLLTLTAGLLFKCFPAGSIKTSSLGFLSALAVFAVVGLPWYAYIRHVLASNPELAGVFQTEVAKILQGDAHTRPFHYYLGRLPARLLPWGLAMPFALWAAYECARKDRNIRFLLVWWSVTFVLLSAMPQKQEHYLMLILPQSALLLGVWLDRLLFGPDSRSKRALTFVLQFFPTLGIIAGVALTAAAANGTLPVSTMHVIWAATLIFVGAAGVWRTRAKKPGLLFGWTAGTMLLLFWVHSLVLHPFRVDEAVVPDFIRKVKTEIAAIDGAQSARLYCTPNHFEEIAVYLGPDLKRIQPGRKLWRNPPPGTWLIATSSPRHPENFQAIPWAEHLAMQSREFQCRLYRKPEVLPSGPSR